MGEIAKQEIEELEKILIVDDEEMIRNLLTDTLEKLGYICESARNGLECLQKIYNEKYRYDTVLLDIQMPGLDGIKTLRRLKTHSPHLSTVMISASRDIEDVKVALKEGAYDYIFKPFDISEIETVIKRAVERAKLISENIDYQKNLEKKVETQTKELVNLYAGTLEAMVLALDLREHETGYHSYRVTEYAISLAKQMQVTDSDLSVIAKGALLHDIGKIGVPDEILLKPYQLTEEEWKLMKEHPTLGYELLRKIKFLEEAANVVLSHHEQYDGGGYPRGISGKDIPLGARIFSIVDALDALTSERTYKKPTSFDEAIEKITLASGKHFDPDIIEVFLQIPKTVWIEKRKSVEDSDSNYLKNLLYKLSKS